MQGRWFGWGLLLASFVATANDQQKLDYVSQITQVVIADKGLSDFSLSNASQAQLAFKASGHADFNQFLRVTTNTQVKHPYHIQLFQKVTPIVRKNDMFLLSFYARSHASNDESGQAQTVAVFESLDDRYHKSLVYNVSLSTEWKQYFVPFKIDASQIAASQSRAEQAGHQLAFRLGYGPQVVDFAKIELVKLANNTDYNSLPATPVEYKTAIDNPRWLIEATQRIEKIRKQNFSIRVVDHYQTPIVGRLVDIRMIKHQFAFGTAINTTAVTAESRNTDKYYAALKNNFNQVVFEGGMKWPYWREKQQGVETLIAWAISQNFRVRGHTLVWPSWRKSPWQHQDDKIEMYSQNPQKLATKIKQHIKDILGHYGDDIVEWDVVNEPYANNDFTNLLGKTALIDWFHTAKRHVKGAKLFLNDYGILTNGQHDDADHIEYYYRLIRYLLDHNTPLDGIGMQGHFRGVLTSPTDLYSLLQRFSEFNLPIVITEYDHRTDNEVLQAEYLHDFLTVIFSTEQVTGFNMWGFWDGKHWANNAPLFDQHWRLKPSGQAYRNLVYQKWWSHFTGITDQRGMYTARGFKGDYEIVIDWQGKVIKKVVTIGDNAATIDIVLPAPL